MARRKKSPKKPTSRPRTKAGFRRFGGAKKKAEKHVNTRKSRLDRKRKGRADKPARKSAKPSTRTKQIVGKKKSRSTQRRKKIIPRTASRAKRVVRKRVRQSTVERQDKLHRQLEDARTSIRNRDKVIRELTRFPIGRERQQVLKQAKRSGDAVEVDEGVIPPGATVIGHGTDGSPIISMGEYVEGREWDDIDWEDVDYDDYADDFGEDEQEVDYGGSDES